MTLKVNWCHLQTEKTQTGLYYFWMVVGHVIQLVHLCVSSFGLPLLTIQRCQETILFQHWNNTVPNYCACSCYMSLFTSVLHVYTTTSWNSWPTPIDIIHGDDMIPGIQQISDDHCCSQPTREQQSCIDNNQSNQIKSSDRSISRSIH